MSAADIYMHFSRNRYPLFGLKNSQIKKKPNVFHLLQNRQITFFHPLKDQNVLIGDYFCLESFVHFSITTTR